MWKKKILESLIGMENELFEYTLDLTVLCWYPLVTLYNIIVFVELD